MRFSLTQLLLAAALCALIASLTGAVRRHAQSKGQPAALMFSPDGKRLLVHLKEGLFGLAPDGATIVTASLQFKEGAHDWLISLRDSESWQKRGEIRFPSRGAWPHVKFSLNGQFAVIHGSSAISLCRTADVAELLRVERTARSHDDPAAVSADGRTLAISTGDDVQILDVATGRSACVLWRDATRKAIGWHVAGFGLWLAACGWAFHRRRRERSS